MGAGLLLATGLGNTASGAPARIQDADAIRGPGKVLPPSDSANYGSGFTGVATSARIGRAAANINVPGFTAVAYGQPFYREQEQHRVGFSFNPVFIRATGGFLPRHPDPRCDYFYAGLFSDIYAADIKQKINSADPVNSAPGVFRSVGILPDTPVSLLAFGSVPVTATLHLRQLADAQGKIEPLFVDEKTTAFSIRKTTPTSNPTDVPTGCDREWELEPTPSYIRGRLKASVTDIKIDGRSISVAPTCRTTVPLDINLTGEPPEFGGKLSDHGPEGGGIMYQRFDRGTVRADNPTQRYPDSSNLTIPPFTGCRTSSGDDVSRLITAIVSGPDNTIALNFTIPTFDGTVLDREHPNICTQLYGCALPPVHVLPPAPGR